MPECSLLPRYPRDVWEKARKRVSLDDVTAQEQRTPRAEAIFSVDPCLLLLLSALLLLVMSALLLRAS